jgi:hypothetical protein
MSATDRSMRLWTKRDCFVPVAATQAGSGKNGREQGVAGELWKDRDSLVAVAAAWGGLSSVANRSVCVGHPRGSGRTGYAA